MLTAPIVIKRKSVKDGWYAVLSDGREIAQDDVKGYLSAWLRLKQICENDRVYITRLFLTVGVVTIEVEGNNKGYWQASAFDVVWGGETGENSDLHWKGIGYVDDSGIVNIKWLAYPQTPHVNAVKNPYAVLNGDKVVALSADEKRIAVTQTQIIWSER